MDIYSVRFQICESASNPLIYPGKCFETAQIQKCYMPSLVNHPEKAIVSLLKGHFDKNTLLKASFISLLVVPCRCIEMLVPKWGIDLIGCFILTLFSQSFTILFTLTSPHCRISPNLLNIESMVISQKNRVKYYLRSFLCGYHNK